MTRSLPLFFAAFAAAGCAADALTIEPGDYTKTNPFGKDDSSVEAIFVDMEFDGELFTDSSVGLSTQIEDQLLYTIGHLNGDNSLGRLDRLQLSEIKSIPVDGGQRVTYHAILPVAWGQRDAVPSSYTFRLPRDTTFDGYEKFTEKYKDSCVDFAAHDVTSGIMWYYYRTEAFGCELDDADVVTFDADVSVSAINTTGKFPEYDKVWEDGVLKVVAVFGKFKDFETDNSDAGIAAYNSFVSAVKKQLGALGSITAPATFPAKPGVEVPDIQFEATLAPGKKIQVNALLVDNVRQAGPEFDARYAELSTRADMIAYNGHAGLGANVRALARKGVWTTGQYVVVFMNGCDTFAYIDDALADAHSEINADDPDGIKYVDMVTNAMPSFFQSMPDATLALMSGLSQFDDPKTYEQMFADIDFREVVLVSGEQDNSFVPGGGGKGEKWEGMKESGQIARNAEKRFETPVLKAGRYRFELSGSGDADLYVRIGKAPTTATFDCRPFKSGSSEVCEVSLPADAPVHVLVRGFAVSSSYQLAAGPQ